ncbi:MAG: hypothetical protein P4L42_03385 [Desulfocapsaceae bacterium]|nr:hypothetical protein [Desulfocapsaceae bacterium]
MERIKFGSETKMTILADNCPGCNAYRGQLHQYACVVESCPQCGSRLLRCTCKALSMAESLKITKAVADGITDRSEIRRTSDTGSEHLDASYYEEGVMLWIIRDVTARDQAAAAKMNELLADTGFKHVGKGYAISAEDAARHMGVPVEEARAILEEMQADAVYPGWQDQEGTAKA